MAKKRRVPRPIDQMQPRMTPAEKDDLFVHVLRCPGFFKEAIGRLEALRTDRVIAEDYRLLIQGCLAVTEKHGIGPEDPTFRRLLKTDIRRRADEIPEDDVLEDVADELTDDDGFIDRAFATDSDELHKRHARALLRRLLYEYTVVNPLDSLLGDSKLGGMMPKDLADVLQKFAERTRSLETIDTEGIKTVADDWVEHRARLRPFRHRTLAGLATGLAELDRRTLGLRGVFVLGAKPGAGKTTYGCVEVALGVCANHADNDAVVVVVSLDMDRWSLYSRIHCNLGDIEWAPLMFGSPESSRAANSQFSEEHLACLETAQQRLEERQIGTRLAVLDREFLGDDITAARLLAVIREVKKRARAKRALLIVDYLQILPVPDEVAERGDLAADKYRVRIMQKVIENTKTSADPLGDTALLISEARKPPRAKDIWGESMSELMGSARLGYAADAVLLYREMTTREIQEHYRVHEKDRAERHRDALKEEGIAPVMLILEKGRDGMQRGKWPTEFFFRKSVFREIVPCARPSTAPVSPPPDDSADGDGDGEPPEPVRVTADGEPPEPVRVTADGRMHLPPLGRCDSGKVKRRRAARPSRGKKGVKAKTTAAADEEQPAAEQPARRKA
jgi:replicative DNA helicase